MLGNITPSNGKEVVMTIRNSSIKGEGSRPIRIDINGDIISYFYLMDFNSRQNKYVSVLEMIPLNDKPTLVETNDPIIWPNGQILQPDICDFTVCESGGEYSRKIFPIIKQCNYVPIGGYRIRISGNVNKIIIRQ